MPRTAHEPDTSTYKGRVAAQIRRRRERAKLSVAEAAQRAGVPVQTWYHWEQGRTLPVEALATVARALRCQPKHLVPDVAS
jgi:DNA-binding transcriptional regulator YiaG